MHKALSKDLALLRMGHSTFRINRKIMSASVLHVHISWVVEVMLKVIEMCLKFKPSTMTEGFWDPLLFFICLGM